MALQTTIVPKIRPRERILMFGSGGVGKSEQALRIMRAQTTGHFYIADIDVTPTYERMLATDFQDVEERGNYTLSEFDPIDDWDAVLKYVQNAAEVSTENDWLVLDPITPTWEQVRSWYLDYTMNSPDLAGYLAELRRTSKDNSEYMRKVMDTMNYDLINKEYARLYTAIRKFRGHVYLTAESTAVDSKNDSKELQNTFAGYGVRPKGQKKLMHVPATILIATKKRPGEWKVTTVKDRGRTELIEADMNDFVSDYLISVAGWSKRVVRQVTTEGEQ